MADDAKASNERARREVRPDEGEFLAAVLAELDDLPPGLAARMAPLVELSEDRAGAIRDLFEELTGE